MRTPTRSFLLPAVLTLVAMLAACTSGGSSVEPSASSEASVAESMAASEAPDECVAENLETKQDGLLTVGTDNPAYPPYFDPPGDDEEAPKPWSDGIGDPTNGRGFESAVAYAVADELGFSADQVEWIALGYQESYAPGPKDFDFYLAQISYTPRRAESANLSDGYYFSNQALVAREGTPITEAGSIADVAGYQLGVAQGTTSLDYIEQVIQPSQETRVYNDNDGALDGLNAGQVQGIVVDLPTAFYMRDAQMDDGVIVGQFPPQEGQEQEHFSLVLEKDSPLTDCVNQAIAALTDSGELEDIAQEWMSQTAGAPVLE